MNCPIFVVGFQRSGTTLLQSLLGAHPRIAAPPEMHFVFRVAALADYFGDLADDDNLARALHETINPHVPMFAECGFDEPALLARAGRAPRTYAGLLDAVMTDFAERQGKQRWCEKTPLQPASSALALFPDAQIVHIVRDPRAAIASASGTPWTPESTRALAHSWQRFTAENLSTGAEAGPAAFHQVRYDDLTADPETVLRGICAFLGEEFDPGMLSDPERRRSAVGGPVSSWHGNVLRPVTTQTERWRTSLRPWQRSLIGAVADRELGRLGYEQVDARTRRLGRAIDRVTSLGWRDLRNAVERVRVRRMATTPAGRYAAAQRFQARVASALAAESSRS